MIYVKFIVSTEYCGTENEIFLAYEDGTPESSIEIDFLERARENAENYEYLVTGWNDENYEEDEEEERQEDLKQYYENAEDYYSNWEYITEEEYKEGTE